MSEGQNPPELAKDDVDKIVRDVQLLVKKGDRLQATERLKKAVTDYPKEPAFWEAYGDLLLEAEQLGEARDAFFQAKEIKKPRLNAERKYADTVFRINTGGMIMPVEDVPGNPKGMLFLSLLLPGAGQYFNGQLQKAAIFFVAWLILLIPIIVILSDANSSPVKSSHISKQAFDNLMAAVTGGVGLVILIAQLVVVVWASGDAYMIAKKNQEAMGGPLFSKDKKMKMPDMSFFDDVIPKKDKSAQADDNHEIKHENSSN